MSAVSTNAWGWTKNFAHFDMESSAPGKVLLHDPGQPLPLRNTIFPSFARPPGLLLHLRQVGCEAIGVYPDNLSGPFDGG